MGLEVGTGGTKLGISVTTLLPSFAPVLTVLLPMDQHHHHHHHHHKPPEPPDPKAKETLEKPPSKNYLKHNTQKLLNYELLSTQLPERLKLYKDIYRNRTQAPIKSHVLTGKLNLQKPQKQKYNIAQLTQSLPIVEIV